jgi:hypothetical protein
MRICREAFAQAEDRARRSFGKHTLPDLGRSENSHLAPPHQVDSRGFSALLKKERARFVSTWSCNRFEFAPELVTFGLALTLSHAGTPWLL